MPLDTSPIDYSEMMLGRLTDAVHDFFHEIFDTEGAEFGEAWEPLSPETEAKKMRLGQSTAILVAQDDLRRSLAFGVGFGYSELRDNGATLAVGTDDPKAVFHQLGTQRMPQRKIAPDADEIPKVYINEWSDLVDRHARREVGKRLGAAFKSFRDAAEGAEGVLHIVLDGFEDLAEVVAL